MIAFLEGPELLIIVAILIPLGIDLWALIDGATKPDWAWRQAGANKVLYMVLIIGGFFLCGIVGLVTSIVYLASTRQRIAAAMAGGYGGPGSYGTPPGGVPTYQGYQPYQQYPSQGYGPPPHGAAAPQGPGWWQASDGWWYPPPNPQEQMPTSGT